MQAAKPRTPSALPTPALARGDAAVETWLRDEVAGYDAMVSDPGRGISAAQAVAALAAHHASRLKKAPSEP